MTNRIIAVKNKICEKNKNPGVLMTDMKKLVIVESPSKATTIEKYLGNGFNVVASKGHICDLATSGKGGLGIDVDNQFATTYVVPKEKMALVRQLAKDVKNYDKVYLATDPDREGEAIAYHLARKLNLDFDDNNRIVFHEVTKSAVNNAINNPGKIDMDLVNSQETRRILDRIIGFKLSTLLNKKIKSKSAGRVQSAALKMIVDREREIAAFLAQEYWTISANFKKDNIDFIGELSKADNKKPELNDQQQAQQIIDRCKDNDFIISEVKEEIKNKKAKYPYTTSTMQQDSANKLYFSSKKTMQIAQKLYEGIEIDTGTTGLITYMRSDSNRLSNEFIDATKQYISDNYGKEYVGSYQQKVDKNAQDAHEAIRPTNINNNPEKIKEYLTNDQYKLYKLIYYRALACIMADAKFASTNVSLLNNGCLFTTSGKQMIFDGYLKVYQQYETSEDKQLPLLEEKTTIKADSIESKQHFTQPPDRYSEARLIKAMEEFGIGRPSTYATIIDTIVQREYVTLEKSSEGSKVKVFVPSKQGVLTTEKLEEYFQQIVDLKYTANMEKQLDEIAEGKLDKLTSLNEFYQPFMDLVSYANEHMEKLEAEKTGELCPQCGHELVVRKGKYGNFIACSNYPECKYIQKQPEQEDQQDFGTCPNCGSKLVEKQGRYGKFIACSNYPECKYIVNNKPAAIETGEICPQCGSALVIRKSRYGKEFVGCSNYPKCHYIKKDNSVAKTRKK